MKLRIFNIIFFTCISAAFIRPIKAATTAIKCSGTIPKNTICYINANTYELEILRVDICQNDPFPNYRKTADYPGSKCLNLFFNDKNLVKYNKN